MNIRRIMADIKTAENLISTNGNPTNDEYMYDLAAYHTQQAVEKCLKYYLHYIFGMDDTTKKFKTHNISTLLLLLTQYSYTAPKELINMSDELTNWEASARYGEDLIGTKNNISKGIKIAKYLVSDIPNVRHNYEQKISNERDVITKDCEIEGCNDIFDLQKE